MMDAGPLGYWDRMQKLKEERNSREKQVGIEPNDSMLTWDGVGPCPCCGWTKEKALQDDGAQKIMKLLGELEEREREKKAGAAPAALSH